LRLGNAAAFFAAFTVTFAACALVRRLRIALVFFGRRSSGRYFEPDSCDRIPARRSCEMTVRTRATPLRTDLILASLLAAPPVILATRRAASSCLRSLSWREFFF